MNIQSQAQNLRPGAGRPSKAQAQARHEELLDVSLDMFLDKGFEQTTIDAVAAAVGMTKRTVYARYESKAVLFKATVERAIDRATVPPNQLASLSQGDLEATLKAVAKMRVANVMTPAGLKLQRIINTESYRFPEIFTSSYDRTGKPVVEFIAALLRSALAKGTVSLDNPDLAANIFMSMVVSGPVRIIVSGNPLSRREIDERIDFAVQLFLKGALVR